MWKQNVKMCVSTKFYLCLNFNIHIYIWNAFCEKFKTQTKMKWKLHICIYCFHGRWRHTPRRGVATYIFDHLQLCAHCRILGQYVCMFCWKRHTCMFHLFTLYIETCCVHGCENYSLPEHPHKQYTWILKRCNKLW